LYEYFYYVCYKQINSHILKKLPMKKLFIISAVLATFAFTSCKKEYTCTCTDLVGYNSYEKTGKGKDADAACADATDKVLGIPQEICTPKE
jgi:hypothetical protein